MPQAIDDTLREEFSRMLREELTDLQRLSEETKDGRAPVALDQLSVARLSRMDALRGQALAQASDRRRLERRVALEMALRRVEDGEYGYCVDCGEPISVQRLRIDPAAALCIGCAGRSGR